MSGETKLEAYASVLLTAGFVAPAGVRHVDVRRGRDDGTYELHVAVDGEDVGDAKARLHEICAILAKALTETGTDNQR